MVAGGDVTVRVDVPLWSTSRIRNCMHQTKTCCNVEAPLSLRTSSHQGQEQLQQLTAVRSLSLDTHVLVFVRPVPENGHGIISILSQISYFFQQ